jgi:hypothetical protein
MEHCGRGHVHSDGHLGTRYELRRSCSKPKGGPHQLCPEGACATATPSGNDKEWQADSSLHVWMEV